MEHITGDETADFLLRQIAFLRRVGSPAQQAAAGKWALIVLVHASAAETEAEAVNFATTDAGEKGKP